jgi:hypothetical protein
MWSGRSSNKVGLSRLGSLFHLAWQGQTLLCDAWTFSTFLDEVDHLLPPFHIIICPYYNPNFLFVYFIKNATLEAATGGTCESLSLKTISPFIFDHHLACRQNTKDGSLVFGLRIANESPICYSVCGVSIGNAGLRIVFHVCGVSVWEGEMCGVEFVSLLGHGCSATTE